MIEEFYAQIEPLLKEAGYTGRMLKSGKFIVRKGKVSVTIYHHPLPTDPTFERVCLWYSMKGKRYKEMEPFLGFGMTQSLTVHNPEFGFLCTVNPTAFNVIYYCDIIEPQDLLNQLEYANARFLRIRKQADEEVARYSELMQNIDNE